MNGKKDDLTCLFIQYDLENDSLVKNREIILQSKDGHALWVSASVLQRMLPLPDEIEGGFIARDEQGNPTGDFLKLRPHKGFSLTFCG